MKKLISILFILACSAAVHLQSQEPENQVFYWVTDKTGSSDAFLNKYNPANHNNCKHYIARVDGINLQRAAAVAFKAGTSHFNGLKAYYEAGGDMIIGLNSGLMNKSYEYANRQDWRSKFSGDVAIMGTAKAAGATRVVMFMQSPLSKGQQADFDPNIKSSKNPNGGATLDMRVADCFEYAEYIWARKPDNLEVTFGLIDAYPAKSPQPGSAFHAAYVNLAKGLQERGMLLEEIQFDMKTATVTSSATRLLTAMERAYSEINATTGTDVRMSWYTWWGASQATTGQMNAALAKALNNIANHPKRNSMTGINLAGNAEDRNGIVDLIPTDMNTTRTITARTNEAYSILEKLGTMNPVHADDPILTSTSATRVADSVMQLPEKADLTLYPNPTNAGLTIRHNLAGFVTIHIYNVSGVPVCQAHSDQQNWTVDLNHLTSGSYFVTIKNSVHSVTKKVVVLK